MDSQDSISLNSYTDNLRSRPILLRKRKISVTMECIKNNIRELSYYATFIYILFILKRSIVLKLHGKLKLVNSITKQFFENTSEARTQDSLL